MAFTSFKFDRGANILKRIILCECGEFVEGHTFKDYIPTSRGPSTPTMGHVSCGLIFDFTDGELPKSFSTRVELKGIAVKFAQINRMDEAILGKFLLAVDRLKSGGNLCDIDILIAAYRSTDEKADNMIF